MNAEPPPLRIGNAERTAALKALDEHLAAGRLGVEEYADRSAAAANAVVAADLVALFTDLPEPHPDLPSSAPPRRAPAPVAGAQSAPADAGRPAQRWGLPLISLAVLAAIFLLVVTRQGAVMLLIPLVAVLLWASRRR
jgi:Domain of unknown function (DUF1707)